MAHARSGHFPGAMVGSHFLNWLLLIGTAVCLACSSRQRTDRDWIAALPHPPREEAGARSIVWIDEAHNNVVTTHGRFEPFEAALEAYGYEVRPFQSEFTSEALIDVHLLVIGTALNDRNVDAWQNLEAGNRPTGPTPSYPAFTNEEIDALYEWVFEGGRLLLLTDHTPFAGAAADLGRRFGFTFLDCFVEDSETGDPVRFSRSEGTLRDHPITIGSGGDTDVESVATFVGQAFKAAGADPLMVLGTTTVAYQPQIWWDYDHQTPSTSVAGWLQGATDEVGEGRIAVFGDTNMFFAQVRRDGRLIGMNSGPGAHHLQFLLNIMQWLSGPDGPA